MQKTSNYQLNQWEPTDKLSREDFNSDNATIDAALKAVADSQATISQSVATLSTALGSGGKTCRIAWGSYTGTGAYGAGSPNSLSFDFCPVMVLILCSTANYISAFVRGSSRGTCCQSTNYHPTVSWNDKSVSWYYTGDSGCQNNTSGAVYTYVAVGYSA